MLYITTRDKTDSHTAYRTLSDNRAPDGGFFVPFQMPKLDHQFITSLQDRSFGQNVAEILNLLFSARLDGWDVDVAIGRNPTKLVAMSHRIVFAELWHNPDTDFSRLVRNLTGRIHGLEEYREKPTNWAEIAVRIAILFGVYGELQRVNLTDPHRGMDVAVATGDFTAPMAVWYAREMGLPVGNIVCGCNDNGGVWDLLHHGELRTDGNPVTTGTPKGDLIVPPDLERLIFGTLGTAEVARFLEACTEGKTYAPPQGCFEAFRRGMYAGVVSTQRMENIIRSVYNTSTYVMDPYSALAYCGLQDYRNRYSESRPALVLSDRSPIHFADTVSASLGISVEELSDRLNLT